MAFLLTSPKVLRDNEETSASLYFLAFEEKKQDSVPNPSLCLLLWEKKQQFWTQRWDNPYFPLTFYAVHANTADTAFYCFFSFHVRLNIGRYHGGAQNSNSKYVGSGTAKAQYSSKNKERSNKTTNSGIWLCPGIHWNVLMEGALNSPLTHQCHFNKNRLVYLCCQVQNPPLGCCNFPDCFRTFYATVWTAAQFPNSLGGHFQGARDGVWLQYSFTQKVKICPVAHCCNSQREVIPVINWLAHGWQISV